jgi:hypothetical protein
LIAFSSPPLCMQFTCPANLGPLRR